MEGKNRLLTEKAFMKIIVGLGNPGLKYRMTRHNAGFMTLDMLAGKHGLRFRKTAFDSKCAEGRICGKEVFLAKPQTYMNRSGIAVAGLCGMISSVGEDLLLVSDDLDLPVGRLRLRGRGSSGGHKGLRSVINAVGSDFYRLRLGIIDGVVYDASSYVLSRFPRAEKQEVSAMLERACSCIETWLVEGPLAAMNAHNQDLPG